MGYEERVEKRQAGWATNARFGGLRAGLISGASVVFWLMFGINLVNYLDRFVVVAVSKTLTQEFHINDFQYGILTSAFLLVYTIAGLPLGLLADRLPRARIVALGVLIWSIFSGATAFATNFFGLMITRIGVGIGEASYLPAGTALLSEYFPIERRARVMSRWGAGQIVGIASAFVVSFVLFLLFKPEFAWRVAFFVTALPGLALALLMWFVAERPAAAPAPSATTPAAEPREEPAAVGGHATLSMAGGMRGLVEQFTSALRIRTVRVVIVLQALYLIVATPAIAYLPKYIEAPNGPFGLSESAGTAASGVMLILGGLGGAIAGGYAADWLAQRDKGGRVLLTSLASMLALPCYAITLLTHSLPVFLVLGTLAIFAISLQVGPLTAAVQDATPPALRATAVGITLLLAHLCGDIWAPGLVGWISTKLGEQAGLALMIVGLPTLAVAIVMGYFGSRQYARDVTGRAASGGR